MGISEVVSPVTRRGSKVGSNQPLSPGARSDPGREGDPKFDSVPKQPAHRTATHQKTPIPGSPTTVTGPEE
jgi:hypothetical protein